MVAAMCRSRYAQVISAESGTTDKLQGARFSLLDKLARQDRKTREYSDIFLAEVEFPAFGGAIEWALGSCDDLDWI